MRTYVALYKNLKTTVQAESSYAAQLQAAKQFKAKKSYDVTVILADTPLDPASL